MSSADQTVTVLLAAPCEARDALRAALEGTRHALIEVDPLSSDAQSVLKHSPQNVVVLLDGNSEDALDKFDSVLADPSIRLLFEEASVVTARQGWDSARWSRHLSAKLIGSTDVLPEGVGDDQGFVAPKPRDAVRKAATDGREGIASEDSEPDRAPEPVSEDQQFLAEALQSDPEDLQPLPDEFDVAPAPVVEPVTIEGALPEDDLTWQMFQAYDVDDAWKPEAAAAPAPEPAPPVDIDPLPASEFNFQTGISPAGIQSAEEIDVPALPNDLPQASETLRATDMTAALDAPVSSREWSLADPDDVADIPVAPVPSPMPKFESAGSRFSGLSLLDDGTMGLEAEPAAPEAASTGEIARDGAVFLLGGAGGPDPLRTVLGALPAAFPRPVFILQHLDAGNYDRLARQMERASNLQVELATPGAQITRGSAYVLSPGISVEKTSQGFAFVEEREKRGFVDFSDEFPAADSAIVFLSGADVDWADTGARFKARGAWLAAQAEIGCFDFAVPAIMINRGAEAHDALSIAQNLSARWSKEEQQ